MAKSYPQPLYRDAVIESTRTGTGHRQYSPWLGLGPMSQTSMEK